MNIKQLNFENAQIGFRNFEGREGQFNKPGDRSFVVFLNEEDAHDLEKAGWNVKWPKARPDISAEDDNRQPYLQIAVGFDYFPAKLYMVTATGEENEPKVTPMQEAEVGMLDWAELENVDLVVRPYEWTVNGKSGIKAYLKAGYFTLVTDDFSKKYGI